MNEKSIRRLRAKFILTAMSAFGIVMIFIGGLIYLTNMALVKRQIKETANYIIEHEGILPDEDTWKKIKEDHGGAREHEYTIVRFLNEIFNRSVLDRQSLLYESTRFFAIVYDENNVISEINTHNIDQLTTAEASSYGDLALNSIRRSGQLGDYYYKAGSSSSGHTIVVYMDTAAQLDNIYRIMYSVLSLIAIGFILSLIFVRIVSERAIRPEIENAELQKRFITNASHELKTPLAVIKANAEMEELLSGENEWTQSTLRQVDRLNGLIQNLVMITRAQEKEESERVETNIARSIKETAESFLPVAERESKPLLVNVSEPLSMVVNDSEIRQLATLLLDNAIKYCDEGGQIEVNASRKGHWLTLSVSNTYAAGKNVDFNRFFERFYREDSSHNTDHGGYGIGLSIAKTLVERYDGTIRAEWKDNKIKFQCQLKA